MIALDRRSYAPMTEFELEVWLTEQLEAITDELWSRVFDADKRPWTSDDCPWHRRLQRAGIRLELCPICSHIERVANLTTQPRKHENGYHR